jgi:hypothetical protein
MNTEQKCNCCCKEDVCSKKTDYISDCIRIRTAIASDGTEVSIKCKYFKANACDAAVRSEETCNVLQPDPMPLRHVHP